MYILDTDTLSHLHAGNSQVIRAIQQTSDPDLRITIISRIEMLRGRIDYILKAQPGQDLLKAQQLFQRTEDLLAQVPIVPISTESSNYCAQLIDSPKLRKIGRADLIIASIVISHRAILVTRNLRHFRQIPSLMVVNWVD